MLPVAVYYFSEFSTRNKNYCFAFLAEHVAIHAVAIVNVKCCAVATAKNGGYVFSLCCKHVNAYLDALAWTLVYAVGYGFQRCAA